MRGLLQLDESMALDIENLSRNLCYSLHQKHGEILGLRLRKNNPFHIQNKHSRTRPKIDIRIVNVVVYIVYLCSIKRYGGGAYYL